MPRRKRHPDRGLWHVHVAPPTGHSPALSRQGTMPGQGPAKQDHRIDEPSVAEGAVNRRRALLRWRSWRLMLTRAYAQGGSRPDQYAPCPAITAGNVLAMIEMSSQIDQ